MIEGLSRKEKEELYVEKMTELQAQWGNPVDDDWDFSDWTNEQLDKGLEDIIGQLKFEKMKVSVGGMFKLIVWIFVIIGIIGILSFGWRELF